MSTGAPLKNLYRVHFIESNCQAIVEFAGEFQFDQWDQFIAESLQWLANGVVNWDLDLRRMQVISSQFLGAIVKINMLLASRKGLLRIVVEENSRMAQIFYLAKLQRIITIHEAPRLRN